MIVAGGIENWFNENVEHNLMVHYAKVKGNRGRRHRDFSHFVMDRSSR